MKTVWTISIGLLVLNAANASLSVKVQKPKSTGSKAVVKLTMKNTFSEKIEGARATVFLNGEQDKIIGQRTEWVIGGVTNKPALKPDATTTYHFVIVTEKPVTSTRVVFSRIILEGGKLADPKAVSIEFEK